MGYSVIGGLFDQIKKDFETGKEIVSGGLTQCDMAVQGGALEQAKAQGLSDEDIRSYGKQKLGCTEAQLNKYLGSPKTGAKPVMCGEKSAGTMSACFQSIIKNLLYYLTNGGKSAYEYLQKNVPDFQWHYARILTILRNGYQSSVLGKGLTASQKGNLKNLYYEIKNLKDNTNPVGKEWGDMQASVSTTGIPHLITNICRFSGYLEPNSKWMAFKNNMYGHMPAIRPAVIDPDELVTSFFGMPFSGSGVAPGTSTPVSPGASITPTDDEETQKRKTVGKKVTIAAGIGAAVIGGVALLLVMKNKKSPKVTVMPGTENETVLEENENKVEG